MDGSRRVATHTLDPTKSWVGTVENGPLLNCSVGKHSAERAGEVPGAGLGVEGTRALSIPSPMEACGYLSLRAFKTSRSLSKVSRIVGVKLGRFRDYVGPKANFFAGGVVRL